MSRFGMTCVRRLFAATGRAVLSCLLGFALMLTMTPVLTGSSAFAVDDTWEPDPEWESDPDKPGGCIQTGYFTMGILITNSLANMGDTGNVGTGGATAATGDAHGYFTLGIRITNSAPGVTDSGFASGIGEATGSFTLGIRIKDTTPKGAEGGGQGVNEYGSVTYSATFGIRIKDTGLKTDENGQVIKPSANVSWSLGDAQGVEWAQSFVAMDALTVKTDGKTAYPQSAEGTIGGLPATLSWPSFLKDKDGNTVKLEESARTPYNAIYTTKSLVGEEIVAPTGISVDCIVAVGEDANGNAYTLKSLRPGYSVEGWCLNSGKTAVNFDSTMPYVATQESKYAYTPLWKADAYTITFDKSTGDGTMGVGGDASTEVTYDAIMPKVEVPTIDREGYGFIGYYDEQQSSVGAAAPESATKYYSSAGTNATRWNKTNDATLYAHYGLIDYRISYELNGGTNSVRNPTSYNVVNGASTINAPTKVIDKVAEGVTQPYSFAGWYYDAAFTQSLNKNEAAGTWSIPAGKTGDVTLYAKWDLASYDITYELNGGTNAGANPETYDYESGDINLAGATKTGCTFGGWYRDAGFTSVAITKIPANSAGNWTLYAKWNEGTGVPYKVEHYQMGTDGNYATNPQETDTVNGTTTTGAYNYPSAKNYDGFTLASMQVDGVDAAIGAGISIKADGSTVVRYYYSRNQYVLSWRDKSTAALSVTADGQKAANGGKVYYGARVIARVSQASGYNAPVVVADFTPPTGQSSDDFTMPAHDAVLSVSATPIEYSITYALEPGAAMPAGTKTTYTVEDSSFTLSAAPNGTYTFNGWDITAADDSTIRGAGILFNGETYAQVQSGTYGNLVVTPRWKSVVAFSINAVNAPNSPASREAAQGASITLPEPAARAGYSFAGWYDGTTGGTLVGAAGATYTPEGNITLYAHWVAVNYNIVYMVDGREISSADATTIFGEAPITTYSVDSPVISLPKNVAVSGKAFEGWYLDTAFKDGPYAEIADPASWATNKGTLTFRARLKEIDANDIAYTVNFYQETVGWTNGSNMYPGTPTSSVTKYAANGAKVFLSALGSENSFVGYEFNASKSKAENGGSDAVTISASNMNVSIYYDRQTYELEFAGDNATVSADIDGQALTSVATVKYKEPVTMTAQTMGYTFMGWTVAPRMAGQVVPQIMWTDSTSASNSPATFEMPAANIKMTANTTVGTDTPYTVVHKRQAFDGSYDDAKGGVWETEPLTGTTGAIVTGAVRTYDGFDSPAVKTGVAIAADGSTVITYEYPRHKSKLEWTEGTGSTLQVEKGDGSNASGGAFTAMTSGSEVYFDQPVKVTATAQPGYENPTVTAANATVTDGAFNMPDNAVALTSSATACTYTIEYATDTGVVKKDGVDTPGTVTSQSHTYATADYGSWAIAAGPTSGVVGYDFLGWSIDEDAATADVSVGTVVEDNDFEGIALFGANGGTENVTLYAVWQAKTFTVEYKLGADPYDMEGQPETYAYGTKYDLPDKPTKEGYTVEDWRSNDVAITINESERTFQMRGKHAASVTITAPITISQYTVKYMLDGKELTGEAYGGTYDYGAQIVVAELPEKEGYTTAGWTVTPNDKGIPTMAGVTFDMPASDVTFAATQTINSYTVTYKVDDRVIGEVETHEYNANVKLRDKYVKPGYTVSEWITTADAGVTVGEDGTFAMPAKDVTFTAESTINKHFVYYKIEGGSTNLFLDEWDYGVEVTVRNKAAEEGYTFGPWVTSDVTVTPGAGGASGTFTMPDKDVTFTATKTINSHTVTYQVTGTKPSGAPESPAQATVEYGGSVELQAVPSIDGYRFSGWTVTAGGKNVTVTPGAEGAPDAFTMPDADVTVSGAWTACTYTIKWNTSGYAVQGSSVQGESEATVEAIADTKLVTYDAATFASPMPKAYGSEGSLAFMYWIADGASGSADTHARLLASRTGLSVKGLVEEGIIAASDIRVDDASAQDSTAFTITFDGVWADMITTDMPVTESLKFSMKQDEDTAAVDIDGNAVYLGSTSTYQGENKLVLTGMTLKRSEEASEGETIPLDTLTYISAEGGDPRLMRNDLRLKYDANSGQAAGNDIMFPANEGDAIAMQVSGSDGNGVAFTTDNASFAPGNDIKSAVRLDFTLGFAAPLTFEKFYHVMMDELEKQAGGTAEVNAVYSLDMGSIVYTVAMSSTN